MTQALASWHSVLLQMIGGSSTSRSGSPASLLSVVGFPLWTPHSRRTSSATMKMTPAAIFRYTVHRAVIFVFRVIREGHIEAVSSRSMRIGQHIFTGRFRAHSSAEDLRLKGVEGSADAAVVGNVLP
ncbi:hypothetical protein TYRP_013966 [Tyrophagus putrescentiae]|nr:hypothetical protein TYRP_013966 [Tyrophagus putrescentiae]